MMYVSNKCKKIKDYNLPEGYHLQMAGNGSKGCHPMKVYDKDGKMVNTIEVEDKFIINQSMKIAQDKEENRNTILKAMKSFPEPSKIIEPKYLIDPVELNVEGFKDDVDMEHLKITLLKYESFKGLYEELYDLTSKILNEEENSGKTSNPYVVAPSNRKTKSSARKGFITLEPPDFA